MPPTRTSGCVVALVVFDAARSCEVRLDAPDGAARGRPRIVTLEALDDLAAATGVTADADRRPRRRVPRRRTASASTRPARTACCGRRCCCATRRTSPGSTRRARGFDRAWYAERGLTWLVRAAEVAVLAPDPDGRRRSSARPGSSAGAGSGPAARTEFRDADGDARRPGSTSTGCCSTRAAPRPGSRPSSSRSFRVAEPTRVQLGAGRAAAEPPAEAPTRHVRGPAARARPDGPRQQRGLRRLARGGGRSRPARRRSAAVDAVPRRYRLEYAARGRRRARLDGRGLARRRRLVVPAGRPATGPGAVPRRRCGRLRTDGSDR